MFRRVVAFALAASLSACAGGMSSPPPKPATQELGLIVPLEGPDVVREGERIKARVVALGINVGRLEVNVRAPCASKIDPAWQIEAKMRTVGAAAFFKKLEGVGTSTIQREQVKLFRSHTRVRERDVWREYDVKPKSKHFRVRLERSSGEVKKYRVEMPPGEVLYDTQTAVFAMRAWRPAVGEESYFYVVLGRRLWRADVTYKGLVKIDTDAGVVRSAWYEGTAHRVDLDPGEEYTPRSFAVWFGEDDRRPVRVSGDSSIGAITFHVEEHSFDATCAAPREEVVLQARQAEQQQAEQQRAEQQRAEQQRAEQQRAEQQRAEQQEADEQQRAEQQRAEQQQAEQADVGEVKLTDPAKSRKDDPPRGAP